MQDDLIYTLGDVRISKLIEKRLPFLAPALFPKANEVGLNEADMMELSVHSWLVETPTAKIIVDTGIGNHKKRAQKDFNELDSDFLERLEARGFGGDDVTHVLLTHLHGDHVGWNTVLTHGRWVPTFPKAAYIMPRSNIDRVVGRKLKSDPLQQLFDDSVRPVIEAGQSVLIQPGAEPLPQFRYIESKGHTADHCSIVLETEAGIAVFAGDVMHHPLQVAHPELSSVFCADPPGAAETRSRMLALCADREAFYFSSHFAETSAGKIERAAGGYSWAYL